MSLIEQPVIYQGSRTVFYVTTPVRPRGGDLTVSKNCLPPRGNFAAGGKFARRNDRELLSSGLSYVAFRPGH